MKKILTFFTIAGFLLMVNNFFVWAAETGTVTATVTIQNISVSVSDGTITYGTLANNATSDTTASGIDDSQTATNNGNVTENFNIKGQNSGDWTLASTNGSNIYRHRWCTTNCDTTPTWTALTTSYQTLAAGVAVSGTSIFDLEIQTPNPSTVYTQQNVDVTVQAVAN